MANRFWVDDGGNWSDNLNHWSAASGGAPNASLPGAGDDVFFDANSFTIGAQTVILDVAPDVKSIDWTGATDSPTLAGTQTMDVWGTASVVTFIAAMTSSWTGILALRNSSGTITITTNGLTLNNTINRTGAGAVVFADSYTSDSVSVNAIRVIAGTLNTNGQTITLAGNLRATDGAATITLGASDFNCANWNATHRSITIKAGSSTIYIASKGF